MMNRLIVLTFCLLVIGCDAFKGEPTITGSPIKTEPKRENYSIKSQVNSEKTLHKFTSDYLVEPWRRVGVVVLGGGSELETALTDVLSASLAAALPHMDVIALPRHSRIADSEEITPLYAILLMDVTAIDWRADEDENQTLDIKVRFASLGHPYDNVMYGHVPAYAKVGPSGEFDYHGEVTGRIRSDTLLKKAASEIGEQVEGWAEDWFTENSPLNAPLVRGKEYTAKVESSTEPAIADFLEPLDLPEGAKVRTSGVSTRPSLNRYAWMVFDLAGVAGDATEAVETMMEGWLVPKNETGHPEKWIYRGDSRYETTFVEEGGNYRPTRATERPSIAIRFNIEQLGTGDTSIPFSIMNDIPPEVLLEAFDEKQKPTAEKTPVTRVLLVATQLRTTEELAEMARRQLEREPSELDVLLAYRLQPVRGYEDLTRRLYERAVKVYPEQFMVHAAYAFFLAYRVKDASAAAPHYERAKELLEAYDVDDIHQRRERLDDALENARR